jgi:hypothetical protein
MITRAVFLLTDMKFVMISSRERRETNKYTISQSSCSFGREVLTFWQNLQPTFAGSSFPPRRQRQQISFKSQQVPAAPRNIPEEHRPHILSRLNFTSHTMCTCVTWPFSVAEITDQGNHK